MQRSPGTAHTVARALRRGAVLGAMLAAVCTAVPALAWHPQQTVGLFVPSVTGHVSDMVARGPNVVVTADLADGSDRGFGMFWSTDSGGTWGSTTGLGQVPTPESSAGVCAGHAVVVYIASPGTTGRQVQTFAYGLSGPPTSPVAWSGTSVSVRQPDVTCLANAELAVAWFQKASSGYLVRLKVGEVFGPPSSPQSFSLGAGTPSRDLSITATSDRVYVSWFDGRKLRLARFRIGSTSAHTLTKLGTSTVATLSTASDPVVGADGSRVVLAYRQKGDLKVRRSADKGLSFGTATTIRSTPSGTEATPTTVAVQGARVAIAGVEIKGSTGKGLGYKSTNAGASYSLISSSSAGYKVATLVRPSGATAYHYAEAWDRSFPVGDPIETIRYRRE